MRSKTPQKWYNRTALLAVAAGAVLGAVALLAPSGDGDEREAAGSTSTSATSSTSSTSTTVASSTTSTTEPTTVTTGDGPAAPWRSDPLPRDRVPGPFLEAWGRAKNRASCGLLVPSELGPRMEGATGDFNPTPKDAGWDVYFRRGAGIVEILGLFEPSGEPRPAAFSRSWADGSLARYGPEGVDPSETGVDPDTTANEATLTIPKQGCAYQIYDTLGKSHLEFVLEHLHFVAGTE